MKTQLKFLNIANLEAARLRNVFLFHFSYDYSFVQMGYILGVKYQVKPLGSQTIANNPINAVTDVCFYTSDGRIMKTCEDGWDLHDVDNG